MLSGYKISSDNNVFPICYISFSYKLVLMFLRSELFHHFYWCSCHRNYSISSTVNSLLIWFISSAFSSNYKWSRMPEVILSFVFFICVLQPKSLFRARYDGPRDGREKKINICQRSLVTETVTHICAIDSKLWNRRECRSGVRFFKPNTRYERCCSHFKC